MSARDDRLTVLSRGIDQAAGLLEQVPGADLAGPTPCTDWTLGELAGHVVAAPRNFAAMVRQQPVDWKAPTPHLEGGWAEALRAAGADLVSALGEQSVDPDGDPGGPGPDWQCAEIAVHTWDLATALGRPTADLDPTVAEAGLGFMRANLEADMRGVAFGPEQPAPEGADAFGRIAAFAGRTVVSSV